MDRQLQIYYVTTVLAVLLLTVSLSNAFQTSSRSYQYHKSQILFMAQNNNEQQQQQPSFQEEEKQMNQPSNIFSRRSIIQSTAASTTSAFMLLKNNNANAIDLNPFTPLDQRSPNNYQFTPAKRATAYLVDSTIPPTLVPFKAQREAAILKGLGSGSGTPKTPYIEESLNLNNMMNKGVFGTIDFVKSVAGISDDDDGVIDNTSVQVGGGGDDDTATTNVIPKKVSGYDKSFIFLGVNYNSNEDTNLAIDLITDVIKPRRGLDTALSLSFVPVSLQRALNEYAALPNNADADNFIVNVLVNDGQIPTSIVLNQLPLLQYAKSKSLKLIASSPEPIDIRTVRTQGLQNVDPERRSGYVTDALGFIGWTQDPRNKLYTDRSLLKDFVPLDENESSPSGYFAEKILLHETIATRMANYAFLDGKKNSLVINVSPISDVRFLGGPNGRVARICKSIKPDTIVDDEAVTTILVNPSAEETLSQSKFIRLEIGTAPSNLAYQTKVADYLWFSSPPKVNMLPRMMNG